MVFVPDFFYVLYGQTLGVSAFPLVINYVSLLFGHTSGTSLWFYGYMSRVLYCFSY